MPLRKVRRIDFSSDEWIAGTVGMSLAEEGLYIRICALIYSRGGPIHVEQLHRPGLHGNAINALVEKLVSMGKILRVGDKIDQERCEKELKIVANRVENLAKNGRKGNEIRWQGNKNKRIDIAQRSPSDRLAIATRQTHQQNNGLADSGEQKSAVPRARAGSSNLDSYVSKDTPESPPFLFPPEPEKPHVRRGTRLPADWHPDSADRAYAQKCGLDPDAVAERFADYWHAKAGAGATKLDWHATYRTWCRNEPRYQRHRADKQRPSGDRQDPPSWSSALRRAFPDVS